MGRCYFCGKGPMSGHRISHSHRVTGRWFHPNLQKVRAIIDGKVKRIWVCTKCLKSGKVQRPPIK